MSYLAETEYMNGKCKYPFCGSAPRFLLMITDSVSKHVHEYVVCGKHTAPGLSDAMEKHENAATVREIPRKPRRQSRG